MDQNLADMDSCKTTNRSLHASIRTTDLDAGPVLETGLVFENQLLLEPC